MTASHPQTNYRATCADCEWSYTAASRSRVRMAAKTHRLNEDHDVPAPEKRRVIADGGTDARALFADHDRLFAPVATTANAVNTVHVDRDCPALKRARRVRTLHDRAEVPLRVDVCRRCGDVAVADGGVRRFDVPDGMTLHHVVCRDCPMEQLCDYPDTAKALEHTHAERTGHDVARAEVQR